MKAVRPPFTVLALWWFGAQLTRWGLAVLELGDRRLRVSLFERCPLRERGSR